MKTLIDTNAIIALCDQENISYLGLFGSTARDEAKKTSDVDLMVDFSETKSFFQLARIQEKLEKVFAKKVDLVLKTTVNEPIKSYIQKDLITLYEKRA